MTVILIGIGALGGTSGGWLGTSIARARWATAWPRSVAAVLTGVLCATLVLGGSGRDAGVGPDIVALWFLAAAAVLLASIDIATHRLPDMIVWPSCGVGAILLAGAAAVGGEPARLGRVGAGAFLLASVYLALVLLRPGGMGLGDVKVAGLVGGYLGWAGPAEFAVGACAAFVLGGLAAAVLLMTGRAARGSPIAFGPWIFAGAFVGILGGSGLADGYVSWLTSVQVA